MSTAPAVSNRARRGRRLSVSVFAPWYPEPDALWQGTFVKGQVEALRSLDVDVRVLKIVRRGLFAEVCPIGPDGRPLTSARRVLGSAHLASMIRGSQLWAEPCDVILAEGHWVPTMVRAASLPIVGILHGLDPMTLSGARNDPVRKAIIARSLRRVDELVAVGIPVLHGLPPDLRHRTTVITNGVQLEQYPRRHVSAAQRTMADDFPRFVTVGHVIPTKNHEVLLREFPKVRQIWPRAQWTIIGDGTQRPRLQRLRDDLGLHDAIRFVGRQSPTEVAATLAGSDLFVLPTLRESFGCVFLEAMAVGVPTLIPRSAGASFLVNDERYLHDPTDAGEIIRKARAILATPASYEHAVEHGLRIAERSTWSEHAERLLKVFESSISRRRERSVAA